MAGRRDKAGGISWLKVITWPFRVLVVLILPFVLLIRVSVFFYAELGFNHWLSLGIGFTLTFLLLYSYLIWLYKRITGKKTAKPGARKFNLRLAGLFVIGFGLYALLYLSASNAKTRQVQGEYTSVHPLLRMAVSAWTLFDRDLIITDMSRTHGDYNQMGLRRKKNSLHYTQSDGYVHAVDLRTRDRAEWKNGLIEWYFYLMGFRTLRHVGTEDHLHISLLIRENPAAL